MSDALQFISGAESEAATPLDLFARALLGRPPDDRIGFLVRWSRSEAAREVVAGRISIGAGEVAAYRLLYLAARDEAAAVRAAGPPAAKTRWERALEALAVLRHRQRAAVTLRYMAGLSVADVAAVLGVREAQAREIVEAGVAAIVKAVGGPIDVRRALRVAAQRLTAPPKPRPKPAEPVAAMPRRVVLTLIAPPEILGAGEPARHASPVEALIAPVPVPEPAERRHPEIPEPPPPQHLPRRAAAPVLWRRGTLARRLTVAAALALLVAGTISPAPAGRRAFSTATPVVAAAGSIEAELTDARIEARRLFALLPPPRIVVRPGDSLWTISQRALGDAMRWPEIWRANRLRSMGGGARFTSPGVIRPGWVLRLPG